MTDAASDEKPPEAPSEYSAGSAKGRESEQAKRMAGGQLTTEETYVDLHEHCIALGRVARWDRAAPLLAAGTLFVGGAIGALAAGSRFFSAGVLACGAAGLALIVGGVLLRDERIQSVRAIHESFERRLALYDDNPGVQAIKDRLKLVEDQHKKQRPKLFRRRRNRTSSE